MKLSVPLKTYLIWMIIIATFGVYAKTLHFDFVNYDDIEYVIENPMIKDLSLPSLGGMFMHFYKSNYHPLTILSYAVEYKLFGKDPMMYHFDNVLLHVINAMLVFVFIRKLNGNETVAALVAMLFALHPMHVESVAWISSRKDVLYSVFFLSSMITYMEYREGKAMSIYLFSVGFFMLSVLSKSAALSLILILFAVDYYVGRGISRRSVVEKWPFIIIAATTAVLAFYSQYTSGAIASQSVLHIPYHHRIYIASYAVFYYLFELFFPVHQSAFHPFPQAVEGRLPTIYYVSAAGVVFIALMLWIFRKKLGRELIFALLFYLSSVVLVLQLIPFGHAMVSERYTYLAYIGPLLYISSIVYKKGMSCTVPKSKRIVLAMISVSVLTALSCLTYERLNVWKNSMSLCNDIIDKYPSDTHGYMFRGDSYLQIGILEAALADYNQAIELDSFNYPAIMNRAVLFFRQGRFKLSMRELNRVIRINPAYAQAYANRASLYNRSGQWEKALQDYDTWISLEPKNAEAYFLRASIRNKLHDKAGCCSDLYQSERLGYAFARYIIEDRCK